MQKINGRGSNSDERDLRRRAHREHCESDRRHPLSRDSNAQNTKQDLEDLTAGQGMILIAATLYVSPAKILTAH
jgi:hypothetical protein